MLPLLGGWAPESSPQGPGEPWRVLPELFNSVSGRGTLRVGGKTPKIKTEARVSKRRPSQGRERLRGEGEAPWQPWEFRRGQVREVQSKVTHSLILGPLVEFQFGYSLIFLNRLLRHLWYSNPFCFPSLLGPWSLLGTSLKW